MEKSVFRPISPQPVNTNQFKGLQQKLSMQKPFSALLQSAIASPEKLTISKHAKERMDERNIQISDDRWAHIEEKVIEAGEMGVKDSLVLLHDAALIVSAKNKTVITAMGREEASTHIFTNINGTILLEN